MNVSTEEIEKIISDAKFEFFNSDITFDEMLRGVVTRLQNTHLSNTVEKAAELGEKFGGLDQR